MEIKNMIETERAETGKNVYPEYYEAVAAIAQPRHFPSPVNDTKWIESATDWFLESRTAMEVGPGRGEFAEAVVRKIGGLKKYYIVDMSGGMLNLVRERIQTVETEVEIIFIRADVDCDPLFEIPDGSVGRIIMVNAFQDINPLAALKVFRRKLAPNGLFRANVLSREIREKYCFADDFLDRTTGCFYLTHQPTVENKKGLKPIGSIANKEGEKIPFYRILKSYYRSELAKIFYECGFEIISETPVILPKNVWMNSVAAQGKEHTNTRRLELIDKLGGFPSSVDIIAKPLTNLMKMGDKK
jgi:ubiquinone/menaquinone biosynthesis C-methylase UbiE